MKSKSRKKPAKQPESLAIALVELNNTACRIRDQEIAIKRLFANWEAAKEL